MKNFKIFIFVLFLCVSLWLNAQYPAPVVRYSSYDISSGNIEIRWNPSTAPNITHYKIWYLVPERHGNTDDWDRVGEENDKILATEDLVLSFDPTQLFYVDPLTESIEVGVEAWDSAKARNGLHDYIFDSTIFLQAEYDSCHASVNLNWNRYRFKQWNQPGTKEYRIYISNNNGASFSLADAIPNTSLEYSITGLKENENYLIYISAISQNTLGDSANSNLVYINTDMSVLPKYMYANYASYNKGSTDISFSIDPLSETNTYNILRSKKATLEYDSIFRFVGSEKDFSFSDKVNYQEGPYYYKLEVINYCNVKIMESENIASSILLKREGSYLMPYLNWNEYKRWISGLSSYSLERKFGNTDYMEIANQVNTTFNDNELESLVQNNYAAEVCYKVTAFEYGGSYTSVSNPVCYELPVNIRFEFDAFMPGSGTGNDTFGPSIDFIPDEYTFKVIDRNGRNVYESKEPSDTRWNGYINNVLAPPGAYMCVVQYRVAGGKRHTVRGTVVVVY